MLYKSWCNPVHPLNGYLDRICQCGLHEIWYTYVPPHTCARVFSQTPTHGNSNDEIRKKQTKKVRREAWVQKEATGHLKNKSRRPITSKSKYNNYKHNMAIFYKTWKKYDEIQLTKNEMDLNMKNMTNHPPSIEKPWIK